MTAQLPIWDTTDDATVAILRLIHGDPIHERDRELVVETIIATGRAHRLRMVDPNEVRPKLTGLAYPAVTGAVYGALRRAGVLEPAGWTTSTDTTGRNSGKPVRTYRLNQRWAP